MLSKNEKDVLIFMIIDNNTPQHLHADTLTSSIHKITNSTSNFNDLLYDVLEFIRAIPKVIELECYSGFDLSNTYLFK